jgi:hypothetical protein
MHWGSGFGITGMQVDRVLIVTENVLGVVQQRLGQVKGLPTGCNSERTPCSIWMGQPAEIGTKCLRGAGTLERLSPHRPIG